MVLKFNLIRQSSWGTRLMNLYPTTTRGVTQLATTNLINQPTGQVRHAPFWQRRSMSMDAMTPSPGKTKENRCQLTTLQKNRAPALAKFAHLKACKPG